MRKGIAGRGGGRVKRGYFDRSTFAVTVDVVVHRAGLFFFFLSLSPSPRFLELIVYLVADCFLPPSSCSSREKERERTRENREVEKSIEIREIFIVVPRWGPAPKERNRSTGLLLASYRLIDGLHAISMSLGTVKSWIY